MGGKHKQAQRTKNNARPSSSGRSAELLGTSINPFVGFSTVKDASLPVLTGLPFSSTTIDESEMNLDTNFQLVLKKMNKKDSTTKLKALQEFTELVRSSQPEAVKAVLAFWPRLYAALAVDTEHRVREATHTAHRAVVLKVRRDLAPYLKQLAGPWFTSQYDTYAPAATAATQAFQDAFPPNKVQEAIVFCQDEILSYVCDNITVQTAQTLSNPKTTSTEDAEAKYERVLISSLQGYTLYLTKLSSEQLQAAEELNNRIVSSNKFWKLSKTKIPLIRAAWFGCIAALFHNAPFLLKNEVQQVTTAVFCNLDESEPSVLGATWEAALYIISNVEDWWKHVSVEKLVLPKLWKVLREAGQGSAVVVYPNLLPLISHFPPTVDASILYNNFFENLRIGLRKKTAIQSRIEFSSIVVSFVECLRYITMKYINEESFCKSVITEHLIPTIEWTFSDENVVCKTFYTEVSALLQYWKRNQNESDCKTYKSMMECFWNHLEDSFQSSLTTCIQNDRQDKLESIINKHIELLLCLNKTTVSKQKKHKVKFVSEEKKHESGDTSNNSIGVSSENPYSNELNDIINKTCLFYINFIKDNHRNELIHLLCSLIQHFESQHLFSYLNSKANTIGDKKNMLIDLHKNVFLNFLQVRSTCSESVVDLVFTLYKYLNNEEKICVLDSLTKLKNEECFCWCVAKALSHPYCNDAAVQNWLTTPHVTKLLVDIATAMLTEDEIAAHKILLLKQAFNQNTNGDLFISKEACQEIVLIFCGCLLSPSDYPFTIDTCASFSAQLSATLYTEQSLLTYGDQLILAMFSLSCNTNYDPETLSKDTLWEVSTAWQDILTILIAPTLTTDFENLMWKLTKVLENEFMSTDSATVIDQLTAVAIDLIKCVLQDDKSQQNINYILKFVLNVPSSIRSMKQKITDICNCTRVIKGSLSWPIQCPVPDNVLDETADDNKIFKYLLWNRFVMSVFCTLFKKEVIDDEEEEFQEEAFFVQTTDDINNIIVSALDAYTVAKIYNEYYKPTKLHSKITELTNKITEEYRNFLNSIISKEMLEKIVSIVENNSCDTTYILHSDLLTNDVKMSNVYTRLVKFSDLYSLHLTQLFAKHLTYDHVLEPKEKIEKFVITSTLMHCTETDVQIAETLSAVIAIREKNLEALLYNKNISACSWNDIQMVVEIMRLLKSIIEQKPLTFSSQQWDFVLISLTAWASSADKSKQNYKRVQVAEFISAVCDLYMAFYKFTKNEEVVAQLSQSCSNIVVEYSDLFSLDVHISLINTWLHITAQELEQKETCITMLPVLESVGALISYLEPELIIQKNNVRLPKWQTVVQHCGALLRAREPVLQLCGYHALRRTVPQLVALDEHVVGDQEPKTYGLLSSQLGHVLTTLQDVVQTMLMEFKLGEDSCRVESYTDSYTFTFGYLLLWDIILSFCQFASNDLRYQYSEWMRSGVYLNNLLNNAFRLMPTEVLHCSEGKKNSVVEMFTIEPSFSLSDPLTSERLERVVCWVYTRTLTHLPALVRQWWAEADPRTAHIADQVTAVHVSPMLCAHEMRDVTDRRRAAGENMRVLVHPTAREVVATYTVDEARMELVITLPVNHPLGAVHVECSKQIGGTSQWRSWVMQLTVFLTHQNGRIWDGLALWKSNLDKKFEGVEECYICFSVLHNTTYQLPKLSCQTCRKKFHSPCLYKWFSTSNKSTCPICRNLF